MGRAIPNGGLWKARCRFSGTQKRTQSSFQELPIAICAQSLPLFLLGQPPRFWIHPVFFSNVQIIYFIYFGGLLPPLTKE